MVQSNNFFTVKFNSIKNSLFFLQVQTAPHSFHHHAPETIWEYRLRLRHVRILILVSTFRTFMISTSDDVPCPEIRFHLFISPLTDADVKTPRPLRSRTEGKAPESSPNTWTNTSSALTKSHTSWRESLKVSVHLIYSYWIDSFGLNVGAFL